MGQNCQFQPYLKIIFNILGEVVMIKTDVFGTFLFSIGHWPMYTNKNIQIPNCRPWTKAYQPNFLVDLDWLVEVGRGILSVWGLASGRLERPNNRGPWRQTAGFKALTTNACQSAWSKLPQGILGVWGLANGRLERPNNRGPWRCLRPECLVEASAEDFRRLRAGKQQAWTP